MSPRGKSATFLMLFLLLSSVAPMLTPVQAGGGIHITSDTRWSGEVVIDDNVTVDSGFTLTISAGANLVVGGDFEFRVDGGLIVEGTQSSPVNITTNLTSLGGVTGLWAGLSFAPGANIQVDNMSIEGSRTAVLVEGGAILNNLSLSATHIGIEATGTGAVVKDLVCYGLSHECLRVSGSATVEGVVASNVGSVLQQSGALDITEVVVSDSGRLGNLKDGSSGTHSTITASRMTMLYTIRGDTSVAVSQVSGENLSTLFDVTQSNGLEATNLVFNNISRVIWGSDVGNLTIDDLFVTGLDDDLPAIDLEADSSFTLSDAELTGFSTGLYFTGEGTHTLTNLNVTATREVLDISGEGELMALGGMWIGGVEVAHISDITTSFDGVEIVGGQDASKGLSLISGTHTLTDVTLTRPYSSQDTSSVGIESIWADVIVDGVTLSGWNEGFFTGRNTLLTGEGLTIENGGASQGVAMRIYGASVELVDIYTAHSNTGISLEEGSLHLGDWSATSHTGITLSSGIGTDAVIRNFPAGASLILVDADGEGELLYGTDGEVTIQIPVENTHRFTESTITIEDLNGTPVEGASVEAHGFTELTDADGEATIPLISTGSIVVASDGVYGVSANLTPSSDLVLNLPILPESGDWILPANTTVVLTGGTHNLAGNATIPTGSGLTLRNAILTMPEDAHLTITGSGYLRGEGGEVIGGEVRAYSSVGPLSGGMDGLTIESDIQFTCTQLSISGVVLNGEVTLGDECDVIITDGGAGSVVNVGAFSSLRVHSTLEAFVLDKGEPVEGATVSIAGGDSELTGSNGRAYFITESRVVDELGESWGGMKQVTVSTNTGLIRYGVWDTNESTELTFLFSTLAGGATTGWLRLESLWSPYFLSEALMVSEGTTLTLSPGSWLQVASGVGIEVAGVLEMDGATVSPSSGMGWNGFRAGGEGLRVEISSSQVSGAITTFTMSGNGEFTLTDSLLLGSTDSHIEVSTQDFEQFEVNISSSTLRGSSLYCMRVNGAGVLTEIQDTIFDDCGQYGLWATNGGVSVIDASFTGSDTAMWLQAVTGSLTDINMTDAERTSIGILFESIQSDFTATGIIGNAGIQGAGLVIRESHSVIIADSELTGGIGVRLEGASVTLDGLTMTGEGVAVEIEGRKGAHLTTITDCVVQGYDIALNLSSDEGDSNISPIHSSGNIWGGTVSISSADYPVVSVEDTLLGSVTLSGKEQVTISLEDSPADTIEVTNPLGAVLVKREYTLLLDGAAMTASSHWQVEVREGNAIYQLFNDPWLGDEHSLMLAYRVVTEGGTATPNTAIIQIVIPGYLSVEQSFAVGATGAAEIMIPLTKNIAPLILTTSPVGDATIEQGESLTLNATASDPDYRNGDPELVFLWYLDGEVILNSANGVIEEVELGEHMLRLVVSDPWGGEDVRTFQLEVTLSDNDDDWTEGCDSETWFDTSSNLECGPDVYDADDDNDKVRDERDAFPFDPCASLDADLDGMPNTLVASCETELVEDDDDDNDGVLDDKDPRPLDPKVSSEPDDGGISPLLVAFLLILTGALLFVAVRGSKKVDEAMSGDDVDKKEQEGVLEE